MVFKLSYHLFIPANYYIRNFRSSGGGTADNSGRSQCVAGGQKYTVGSCGVSGTNRKTEIERILNTFKINVKSVFYGIGNSIRIISLSAQHYKTAV